MCSFPIPVGSFAMDLLEVLVNEMYFQGINILNSLQKKFNIDCYYGDSDKIDTTDFNKVFIIQKGVKKNTRNSFNEKDVDKINSLAMSYRDFNFSNNNNPINGNIKSLNTGNLTSKILRNIAGFIGWTNQSVLSKEDRNDINSIFICNSKNKLSNKNDSLIKFNDLLIKLLLNILYNLQGELTVDQDLLKKLVLYYKVNHNNMFMEGKTLDNNAIKLIERSFYDNETITNNENIKSGNNDANAIDQESQKFIRISIEFLVKIINIGLDKDRLEFKEELKDIANGLLEEISKKDISNILNRNFLTFAKDNFLPLTDLKKRLYSYTYNLVDLDKDDYFEIYVHHLKQILSKNFLSNTNLNSELEQDQNLCRSVYINLLKETKINIVLLEDTNSSSSALNTNPIDDNITSISFFVRELHKIYKSLDQYYKNKENKMNIYKYLIDDFFKLVNSNNTRQETFECKENNINLDFNNYFELNFNYTIYLLPANSPSTGDKSNNSLLQNNSNKNNNISSSIFDERANKDFLHMNNSSFLCRYISKKDYIYKTLIYNLWNSVEFDNTENEALNAKRYGLLKENLDFYVSEADSIFNLFLYKIELTKTPAFMLSQNKTFTNLLGDANETEEILFWKNLKIIKREDESIKKKTEFTPITIE